MKRRWDRPHFGRTTTLCAIASILALTALRASASAGGTQLWVQRYKGPDNKRELALSIAASPDGSMVFVTGFSGGATSKSDYATVAYAAATGAQVWVQRYNGPGNE